ncbi:helix-turn-helix transcriptional regulator [Shewanella sp. KX20019]|uniref:helix-turn-helix domain-containing protein n=1 Tax=Shewanella sp. KX20019 TaxID=2803864 RepID=UPI001928C3A9|nr:helix-turn-helix transcriptional regulator [Shewanella sp. KX20019]QQX81656.1 helix-turn-helix transcriptional regulator [Shewanella sp. KX20019]
MSKMTPLVPLIKSQYAIAFIDMLKQIDDDIYPTIAKAQLPESISNIEHDYVPQLPLINLLNIIGEKAGPDKYSQLIWQACRQVFIPSYIDKIKHAKTLGQALNEFCVFFNRESTHSTVKLRHLFGRHWFVREHRFGKELLADFREHFILTFMIELVRGLTQRQWSPKEIALTIDSTGKLEKNLLINNSQFYLNRSVTGISLSSKELAQPIKLKLGWHETQTEQPLKPTLFADSLKHALKPYLGLGRLSIESAASILGIQVRTLQRRLKVENASYSNIVENILFSQASEMMTDRNIPISRIASSLGYSDLPHFSRAFKRITGLSPRAYRRQHS